MGAITLGNQISPTILGGDVLVNTGLSITTLPVSSPVTIQSSGNHSDSYWDLTGNILFPDLLSYKVGLNTVDTGTTSNYILTQDESTREIKRIAGNTYSEVGHNHTWDDITSGKPTTLAGYGITDSQPLDSDLTSISGLGFTSTAFLKKTGSGTWALDTTTYSPTSHTHAYQSTLPICDVDNYVLAGKTDGTLSWVPLPVISGGNGDIDLSLYAPKDAPAFTTSYGFSTWRFYPSGTDLLYKYSGTTKATITSAGTASFVGDVIAYSA